MTPKQLIGYMMLATPFMALFVAGVVMRGLFPTLALTAGLLLLSLWVHAAVTLLE